MRALPWRSRTTGSAARGLQLVRLPVQPEVLARPGMLAVLTDAIGRLQRDGLGVVLSLHPSIGIWKPHRRIARGCAPRGAPRSGVAPIRPHA